MFAPPRWVQELVGSNQAVISSPLVGLALSIVAAPHATFVRVRAAHPCDLDSLAFQRRAVQAYGLIADALRDRPAGHPVRFWNQIPGIHTQMGDGINRYMAFNSARFAAFHEWFGGESALHRAIATATGIGHEGQDLVIDALAADRPGLHVQNPRQRRPFSYSDRYGPFPPCFARATITSCGAVGPRVLIGGTASVRGEESMHIGDLPAQTAETFCNLASLVRASMAASCGVVSESGDVEILAAFESARVYYSQHRRGEDVRSLVEQYLSHLSDIEYLRADICRPELLIEIEGVARINAPLARP